MVPGKMGLLVGVMLLCFARSVHAAALGEDCSSGTGTACTGATLVCDPTDDKCKVKADGTSTDCASTVGNCPANAACNTNTCSCSPGFIAVTTGVTAGLCVVQDAACSGSVACGDTTKYVCSNSQCKVKADEVQTDCSSSDDNCVPDATCAGDGTCSCNTGYSVLATGMCSAIIGFTCANDDECIALDGNTKCSSLACACNLGFKGVAGETCTAVIGSACENNAACSSVLANSECEIVYPCTKGLCACSSGYDDFDCLTLGYDKTCSTSDDKCDDSVGLACSSSTSKCACSTNTYRSEIGVCTDKKILGETCTGTGDCYATNSACDTTCKCSSGYTQDGQVCRRPYAGETCSGTCDKVSTAALLSSETSQQTPSCTASKCVCGTNEQVSRKIGSTCYTVCLSTGGGTTAVGQTCAKFNDCESKVCAECPGDAGPKCYNAPCSGSTFSGSILVCSIILFSIFI